MGAPALQPDLFLAAVSDAPQRDAIDLMSMPIVSLAKRRRTTPIRFRRGDVEVEVAGVAHLGVASIWDLDVILWGIGQIAEAVRAGRPVSATITAPAYDILRAIGRGTSGREYLGLRAALDRLAGTLVRTTVRAEGRRWTAFHLLESYLWTETEGGEVRGVALTLPGWIVAAAVDGRVLAIDPRYFELTGGMARWLYRCVRRQAGDNAAGWRWTLAELHERSGSDRPLKKFAHDLRALAAADGLPEYALTIYADRGGTECLHAVRRSRLALDHPGREGRLRRSRRDPAL